MKGRTNAVSSNGGVKPLITTIRINQNISDPATMITLIEDAGAIQAIRSNSHRYLAKKTADGEVTICQLDDSDSNYYADGTTADLTGGEGDVFMKLPKFYYRAVEFDADIWDISFVYGEKPDYSFKEWDGNDLIGVYKSFVKNTSMYSVSGIEPTGSISPNNFKKYATNRGIGYSAVRWEHHSIMAFLFFSYYQTTNSQSICGAGASETTKASGSSNVLGMADTNVDVSSPQSVNFWGLEDWWASKQEVIDNAVLADAGLLKITNGDEYREISVYEGVGMATKIAIGPYLDVAAKAVGGSGTTGFCDYWQNTATVGHCALRSKSDNDNQAGICYIRTYPAGSNASSVTSRLAFRGNIIEEKDSSVFKNIVALE